jgi:excisionase family DNA binding protein
MSQTPEGLTSAQACERLNIDRSWLSRLVAAGKITTAFRFPGRTGPMLFDPDELDRYDAERQAS